MAGSCRPTARPSPLLDQQVERLGLQKVDFIKLDVDGNEFDVLSGGQQTLRRFRPTLMMELAPYVYESHPKKFDDILRLLWDAGYVVSDVSNGRVLPRDPSEVRRLIPPLGGMNALAVANAAHVRIALELRLRRFRPRSLRRFAGLWIPGQHKPGLQLVYPVGRLDLEFGQSEIEHLAIVRRNGLAGWKIGLWEENVLPVLCRASEFGAISTAAVSPKTALATRGEPAYCTIIGSTPALTGLKYPQTRFSPGEIGRLSMTFRSF